MRFVSGQHMGKLPRIALTTAFESLFFMQVSSIREESFHEMPKMPV
jgi:hypothetical protein